MQSAIGTIMATAWYTCMRKKALSMIDKTEEFVLVTMFSLMVIVIFLQVIMRYVFNNSLVWSEELGKFLFVWISWVGISIGAKRGEHIRITMLVDRLKYSASQRMNIFSEIIVIIICAITAYYGTSLVISQAAARYAGIKISLSWGYAAVVVGCILMILRCLINVSIYIQNIKKGEPTPEIETGGES